MQNLKLKMQNLKLINSVKITAAAFALGMTALLANCQTPAAASTRDLTVDFSCSPELNGGAASVGVITLPEIGGQVKASFVSTLNGEVRSDSFSKTLNENAKNELTEFAAEFAKGGYKDVIVFRLLSDARGETLDFAILPHQGLVIFMDGKEPVAKCEILR